MINTNLILNIYEKKSLRSKLSSQLLYGDKFKIIKKYKDYFKIKTSYDRYIGFIKKKKIVKNFKLTHKVCNLKANLYSKPNYKSKLNKQISFCSSIKVTRIIGDYYNFENYWIKKKDVVTIKKKNKPFNKIKIFKNVKYKWGGTSFNGIDCSALVQIFYKFNNLYCPRDTIDQIKYFKNKTKKFKKNSLIFWKGHVAICISKQKLIHAYGPKKKVLIMPIMITIKKIKKTAKLEVKKVCNI